MKSLFLLPLLALVAQGPALARDGQTETPLRLSHPAVIHADDRTIRLAAGMLARDIAALRGNKPALATNVLSNSAVREIYLSDVPVGIHTLRIYAADPGVILNKVEIVESTRQ